jgi:serine/threonine-protein kinase
MPDDASLQDFLRIRPQLASGSADRALERETAALLRHRLIVVAAVVLATTVALFGSADLGVINDLGLGSLTWPYFLVLLLAFLPPLVILARRPDLNLTWLRILESVIFGSCALILAAGEWTWYAGGWPQAVPQPGQERKFFELVADSHSLGWFVLIILYAACIPASGRRCGVVAGLLAALAILEIPLFALRDPAHADLLLTTVLGKTVLWMAIALPVVIFGARRLTRLRREAVEARRMGQYVLKKRLGGGGMGEVYLCEHQLLRRPCAIKVIRPERALDPTALLRFQREVKAMASLSHPNTVDILDYGQTEDGIFYYVMEYLTGLNLQDIVDNFGPLPPERAVHLLQQACWALREAHLNGLIHRDIKPSNIFVGEAGRIFDVVKLLDFGLVHHRDGPAIAAADHGADADQTWSGQITLAGRVVGTPLFMSPEQIRGRDLDARSDLYSMGVVAYFVLSGAAPFQRKSFKELAAAHIHEPPVPLATVCPAVEADLSDVVMRCLEKEPANRFPDAESLAEALARCACAGHWTRSQAEAWWRANEPALAL